MKEIKVSYFIGGAINTKPEEGTMTIEDIIKVMTNDCFGYSKLPKHKRPYFTVSGQFTYRNNMSLIKDTYTWLCPFDIDYKENPNIDMNLIKNIICSCDSVIFCGKSPSGKGLKGIIRLKKDAYKIEDHYSVLKNIYRKFEKDLGCVFDDAQAKLSQPFYFTFDEDAYINFDAIELDIDYTLPKRDTKSLTGDVSSLKKDYLVDNKCDEILNLTSNKWIEIGKIGYTLGGWFKAGHFNYTEDEIKNKLKDAVDKNINIQNKQHKYEQIDLTFKNGYENPIYIKEENLIDVSEVEWNEVVDDEPLTREELKKYHIALGKAPVHMVIEDSIEIFNFQNKYVEKKYLLYPILKEGQLGILFGVTGEGKSIFMVEIANFIAKGSSDWETFRVDTPPQNIVYIDFELGGESFYSRYKNGKFSDNLKIINVQNNIYNSIIGFNNKQSDRLDRAISYIEDCANKFDSKIIFIDNLSNIADQVEKAAEADRFISDLYARMKAEGLTIFFIGHTPKIALEASITLNQLKGSSSLSKTFESIIGFKRSKEKNISYIKQLKYRQLDCLFDEFNVGKFEFDENDKYGWTMHFIGSDNEIDLLPDNDKGGRPQKYDNVFKSKVLYDLNILAIPPKEIYTKYSINRGVMYRFKEDLTINKYNLEKEYKKYVKQKSEEQQVELLKNKILSGIKIT